MRIGYNACPVPLANVGWGLREGNELDRAVNKCFLSTGETGEFASENLGFDVNPVG